MNIKKFHFRTFNKNNVSTIARLARCWAKIIDYLLALIIFWALPYVISFPLALIYLLIADGIFNGQSLGKQIVGLKVLDIKKMTVCSVKQSVIRNAPLVFPCFFYLLNSTWLQVLFILVFILINSMEFYFIIKPNNFHRIGDRLAQTTVIANDPHHDQYKEQTIEHVVCPSQ